MKKTGKILKVRDHCHFTGKYRGAAHKDCNLKCRKPLFIPVLFHNLQGYDAHLFIKQLAKIPTTEEKYMTFSKYITVDQYYSKKQEKLLPKKFEIRFIDSIKFLITSLAKRVEILAENKNPSDFENINKVFKNNSSLLTRKGVYPYDYVISIKQLKETKLPPKEAFFQNSMMKKSRMNIINMLTMFGILSIVKLFKIITIFISNLMFFFFQMFLRILEKHVWNITK